VNHCAREPYIILSIVVFLFDDQIRTLGYEGAVDEINVRSTRFRTYDGEWVVLPNGDFYTHAVLARMVYDKRRARFTVGHTDSIDKGAAH
jgi:small-conductance mechanosensitive channel